MSRFPDPQSFFDGMYRLQAPWDIGRTQPVLVELLDAHPPSGPVLDLGCGTGDVALHLAGRGLEVLGIDIARGAIEQARAKAAEAELDLAARVEFQVADALRPTLLGRSFGAVVDSGFLHLFEAEARDGLVGPPCRPWRRASRGWEARGPARSARAAALLARRSGHAAPAGNGRRRFFHCGPDPSPAGADSYSRKMHRAGANGSAVAAPNPLREGRDGVPRHAGGRDFFIVGAAKAGTTALHGFLFDDPRVVLPARKETNFYALQGSRPAFTGPLDDAGINAFSIWDRDDYEGEFRGADPGALQGEVCPWYLYSGVAADAIAADNPMAKIAMVLRDPVERAWSAHRHLVADGRERESFANALALEEMRIRAGWEWFWHHTAVSRYAEQVERYLRAFGRDRVRIYLYRDLRRRPERVLNGLTDFIGLPGNGRQTLERRNLSSEPRIWLARLRTMLGQPDLALRALRTIVPARLRDAAKRAMSADAPGTDDLDRGVRRELTEEFLPDVRRLEALTGLDLGEWKP